MWHMYTWKYYPAIKKNKSMTPRELGKKTTLQKNYNASVRRKESIMIFTAEQTLPLSGALVNV